MVAAWATSDRYPQVTVLAWMDLEMTGLDPRVNVIIEIATLVTTDDLEIVAEGPELVASATAADLEAMDEVVRKMHTESGLLARVEASTLSVADLGAATLEFLRGHIPQQGRAPLCGNSIGVDRRFLAAQLPELEAYFHYRSIDVSTVKELCKRWSPALYGRKPVKAGAHRALDDVRESVEELRFYREHFFRLGER
jgi:oligoribonuclease